MKFTPLDIRSREFEKAMRGLDKSDVQAFLHEVASEWEEVLSENLRLKDEILDLRERVKQYQDQDRIFREALLQAQRTKEEIVEDAHREKTLLIKEGQFKAEEILRDAEQQKHELEIQLRNLKLERNRFIQDVDSLMERTRRYLQEEAPEFYNPASPTLSLENLDIDAIDDLDRIPQAKRRAPKP